MSIPTTTAGWLRCLWEYGECFETTHALAEAAVTVDALERSAYHMAPCSRCDEPVICLPEGLAPLCTDCIMTERTVT